MLIILTFTLFLTGFGILKLFQAERFAKQYGIAFLFSFFIIMFFHYGGLWLFDFFRFGGVPGVLHADEHWYHTQAVSQAEAKDLFTPSFYGDWAYFWQVIIALFYSIFGYDAVYPKVANIMFFSISATLIYSIVLKESGSKKITRQSYILFLTYLPLLYYSSTILKEGVLSYLIVSFLFIFYKISNHEIKRKKRWYILLVVFSILLLLTRHQFFLILAALSFFTYVIKSNINLTKKLTMTTLLVLFMGVLISSPLFQAFTFMDRIAGDDQRKSINIGGDQRIFVEGGYGAYALAVITNPTAISRQLIHGSFVYNLHPLPISAFNLSFSQRPIYSINAIHNLLYYFLLPAIFFGIFYKVKMKKFTVFDWMVVGFWSLTMLAIILNGRDPMRYRVSFYFFMMVIYAPVGLHYYPFWKKFIPIILLIYVFAIMTLTLLVDLNAMVGQS